jgi:hypothetical protein
LPLSQCSNWSGFNSLAREKSDVWFYGNTRPRLLLLPESFIFLTSVI